MPDLSEQILPLLRKHRLAGLNLGQEAIHPHYHGGSILNLATAICRLFGVPDLAADPLMDSILDPIQGQGDIRRVVLVLVDALSFHRFRRWMTNGTAPIWAELIGEGLLAPLTSVVPSTTSTCLPSIWSGLSPAAHGLVGYELWLKEYGVVANMIRHAPFHLEVEDSSLSSAGFEPGSYLAGSTLGTHLAAHGVRSWAFQPYAIVDSGLSRMLMKDTNLQPFFGQADMWISLRELLEGSRPDRFFAWAYWGQLDFNSHNYGPDHERCAAEFSSFSRDFSSLFLDQLSVEARRGTILMLAADHGQINTQKDPHYDLNNHPNLTRRLHMLPTGENRLVYFFIRPGQTAAVTEYLSKRFMNRFVTLEPGYAVEAGLFGPGPAHPRLPDRMGDLMALADGDAYLWWAPKPNPIYGRHGGLSEDEMLVPFLAARLG